MSFRGGYADVRRVTLESYSDLSQGLPDQNKPPQCNSTGPGETQWKNVLDSCTFHLLGDFGQFTFPFWTLVFPWTQGLLVVVMAED